MAAGIRNRVALAVVALASAALLNPRPAAAAALGESRLYECVRTAAPPVLDGKLDDACWKHAPVSDDFVRVLRDTDKPVSAQTRIQLLYDANYLYVGVTCDEPNPERIKATVTTPDSASVCGDDSIEMFFQPNPESPDYYQFAANSRGTRYDGRQFDASWNADWTAVGAVGKDAWTLECRIALASFPERCPQWRFNVCRELRSRDPEEYYSWTDIGGPFHNPARFGHLVFSGAFGALRRGYLIEAAGLARQSLEREEELANRLAEIERLRATVPAAVRGRLEQQVRQAQAGRTALEQRYATRTEISIAEWHALNAELERLLAGLKDLYWELKFNALLSD